MHDNILAQPDAVARVLSEERPYIENLAEAIVSDGVESVHFVGIGTSWHAALFGEFLLRTVGGFENARGWNAFEFDMNPPSDYSRSAVVVLSHRSTKTYSAKALQEAKSHKAKVTAIFTGVTSPASRENAPKDSVGPSHHVVHTSRSETSSAFTISHSCAITALLLLAVAVGKRKGSKRAAEVEASVDRLPEVLKATLQTEDDIKRWTSNSQLLNSKHHYFVGYGLNTINAYEVALKIKEACYQLVEGFQIEQYLHGPFVATTHGTHVCFMAPTPNEGSSAVYGYYRTQDLIKAVLTVGGSVSVLVEEGDESLEKNIRAFISSTGGQESTENDRFTVVRLPKASTEGHDEVSSLVTLVALQLFTYHLSMQFKTNPDTFRLDDPKHKEAASHYKL